MSNLNVSSVSVNSDLYFSSILFSLLSKDFFKNVVLLFVEIRVGSILGVSCNFTNSVVFVDFSNSLIIFEKFSLIHSINCRDSIDFL